MLCPHCNQDNPADAQFCNGCGQPTVTLVCPACGKGNSPDSQFCNACGRVLTVASVSDSKQTAPGSYTPRHLAERILTIRSSLEGERKLVTVLFCDIANSVSLAEQVGAEAMHTFLNRFFELALAEVHRYEGTINQFLGDGFMALFGAPIAHEDHARRAALAALGILRVVRDRFKEFREGGQPIEVRMGLNTGLVVVGSIGNNLRMDYTAVGDTTNVAARLQQQAEPGTILISEATMRLLRGYIRIEPVGSLQLKGKNEPVIAYKVLGLGPRRSPIDVVHPRRLSRFVGRDRQLADLHDLLGQVEAGNGQAVAVVAEIGIGKSRLVYEFRRSLGAKRVTYLEGRCLSYGQAIPYLPIIDHLRNNCGIADVDSEEVITEKIKVGLQEVGMDPSESAPYLLHLFGVKAGTERLGILTPEAIKARTFETILQMTQRGSQRRPIILVVEDLHWIDSTSEEYLAQLVKGIAAAGIMVICTYRSGYQLRWINHSYVTQISLPPLSSEDSLTLVQSVLETEFLTEGVMRQILDKAEGNPFFLEELARAVHEQSVRNTVFAVPNTVQGVLMARIDRLPEDTRRVLQTAAVLGREFSQRVLRAMWDGHSVPEPHVVELKEQGLIYERADADEPVYVFKHALTHDVAYESLLESRRKTLHAAAGRVLEVLYAQRLDDAVDRLAYHYSKAEDAPRGVEYLTRSADKAARVYANADAVKALQEALVLVERLPDETRDRFIVTILLRLAHSLYFLGRNADSLDLLRRHRERVERVGSPHLLGAYYFWLGHTYSYLGDQDQARQQARRAIEEAERINEPTIAGRAYYVLARTGIWSGRSRQGVEDGLQAVFLLEKTPERWWLGQSHWVVAGNFYLVGEFESALAALDQCDAIGEAIGDPRLRTYATWTAGLVHTSLGEWEKAIQACQLALDRSPDPINTAAALGFGGGAYVEKGEPGEAITQLIRAVEYLTKFQFWQLLGWFQALLTDAYRLNGQLDAARALAMQAVEVSTGANFQFGVGMARRALGRVAQAEGSFAEAEAYLAAALVDFTDIYARYEVGRTHLDLGVLASTQGYQNVAAGHLADAYALFVTLRVPKFIARTEELAHHLSVVFPRGSSEL